MNKLYSEIEKWFNYKGIEDGEFTKEKLYQLTEDVAIIYNIFLSDIENEFGMLDEPFGSMTDKELFTYFIENIYKKEQP